jgi:hypothetical protein
MDSAHMTKQKELQFSSLLSLLYMETQATGIIMSMNLSPLNSI